MNGQPDEHYLRLALQRKVDETRLDASNAATAIFRKANAVGALNSGSTLSAINEKMKSLYTTQIESMSQFLYNATGKLDRLCADLLAEYGEQLALVIVDPVRSLYENSLHRGLTGINLKMATELQEQLRDEKLRVVDDYRHGMLGDAPLKKDPFVSVTSNIVNSPGAVQQSGIGNLTQTVHQQRLSPLSPLWMASLRTRRSSNLIPIAEKPLKTSPTFFAQRCKRVHPNPAGSTAGETGC